MYIIQEGIDDIEEHNKLVNEAAAALLEYRRSSPAGGKHDRRLSPSGHPDRRPSPLAGGHPAGPTAAAVAGGLSPTSPWCNGGYMTPSLRPMKKNLMTKSERDLQNADKTGRSVSQVSIHETGPETTKLMVPLPTYRTRKSAKAEAEWSLLQKELEGLSKITEISLHAEWLTGKVNETPADKAVFVGNLPRAGSKGRDEVVRVVSP